MLHTNLTGSVGTSNTSSSLSPVSLFNTNVQNNAQPQPHPKVGGAGKVVTILYQELAVQYDNTTESPTLLRPVWETILLLKGTSPLENVGVALVDS